MASTTDIRKGLKIQIDGVPFHVVEHQFVKPGKGQSFTRCSVRNLTNGKVVEKTWKSGESVELADVEDRKMTYSWEEGDSYVFMDTNTGDQLYVDKDKVGDEQRFLAEGLQSTSRSTTATRSASISRRTSSCRSSPASPASRATRRAARASPPRSSPARRSTSPSSSKRASGSRSTRRPAQYLERVNK